MTEEPYHGYKECEGWVGTFTAYMQNEQIGIQLYKWYIPGQGYNGKMKKVEWNPKLNKYETFLYDRLK